MDSWVAARPLPPSDGARDTARLEALRARALVLTLYCSGLRREEATALETVDVLGSIEPGEADIRGWDRIGCMRRRVVRFESGSAPVCSKSIGLATIVN